jgi:hypothetical protein
MTSTHVEMHEASQLARPFRRKVPEGKATRKTMPTMPELKQYLLLIGLGITQYSNN